MYITKKTALKDYPPKEFFMVVIGITFLSILGGFMDGTSVAGIFKIGLTHLTGTTTKLAQHTIDKTKPDSWKQYSYLFFILFYGIGSLMAGVIIGPARLKWRNRQGIVLVLQSIVLLVSFTFSIFQQTHNYGAFMVSLASGLQNGISSNLSSATFRTANVTGTVVDMGLAAGQIIRTKNGKALWKLKIWTPSFLGFFTGALIGVFSFDYLGNQALLMVSIIFLILAVTTFAYSHHKQVERIKQLQEQLKKQLDGSTKKYQK